LGGGGVSTRENFKGKKCCVGRKFVRYESFWEEKFSSGEDLCDEKVSGREKFKRGQMLWEEKITGRKFLRDRESFCETEKERERERERKKFANNVKFVCRIFVLSLQFHFLC